MPKNPVDFVVGTARAQGAGDEIKGLFKPGLPTDPISPELEGALNEATYHALRMGFDLMYIPSVAGYEGGDAWISSESMARKADFHGLRVAYSVQEKGETKWHPGKSLYNVANWVAAKDPKTAEDIARYTSELYDVELPVEKLEILTKCVKKKGDVGPLRNREWMCWQMNEIFKLIKLTPEYNLS